MQNPDQLHFATGGIPLSTLPRNTVNGVKHSRELGLTGMEIEFVRNVNISTVLAPQVRQMAEEQDILLTIHGQYYFNLNSSDLAIVAASIRRAVDAGKIGKQIDAWSICYHSAYMQGMETAAVYAVVKKNMQELLKQYQQHGIPLWFRPEIGGKLSQFGGLKELCELSAEFDHVLPCIDWSHLHARAQGKENTEADFRRILETMEKINGKESLRNVHFHAQGVKYNGKGELCHLELKDADVNYKGWVKIWKEFGCKGQVVCESPNLETDALVLQKAYQNT
ncbi:MAG TPA: TIM barrel protein [Candidatus Nanoarchaeia archaeon]|nr:TIM barrel protein [Candidatus Nanoarchaeia archaeon]